VRRFGIDQLGESRIDRYESGPSHTQFGRVKGYRQLPLLLAAASVAIRLEVMSEL
jgi:hypothetical protein